MNIKDVFRLAGTLVLGVGMSGCGSMNSPEQKCLKILTKSTHQACLALDNTEWAGAVIGNPGSEAVLWAYGINGDGTQKSVFAGHGAVADDGSVRFSDSAREQALPEDTLFLQIGILGCLPSEKTNDGLFLFDCQKMIDPPSDGSQNTQDIYSILYRI